MSIHHLQSCLSNDLVDMILTELSDSDNQEWISDNIVDPILNKVFVKLRGVVITIGVLMSILILLNTLIIVHNIYNRNR